jgi:hypothetical protein
MFDPVAPASVKMTDSAVGTIRAANRLGNLIPVWGLVQFAAKFFGFINRMACTGRKFLVCAGLLMADQAIHVSFRGKIKGFVLPPVAGMT